MLVKSGLIYAAVGTSPPQNKDPTRVWLETFTRLPVVRYLVLYKNISRIRPCIPLRLKTLLSIILLPYKLLLRSECDTVLIHAPEVAIGIWLRQDLCPERKVYFFHGIENPLKNPRYEWGKLIAAVFEYLHFQALKSYDLILVAAGPTEVARLKLRLRTSATIVQFPTRYDDSVFKPVKVLDTDLHRASIKLAVVGRINIAKGWEFLLEVLQFLIHSGKDYSLTFVGDGEDAQKLIQRSRKMNLEHRVRISGFLEPYLVCEEINKADVIVSGSLHEGWPISILEGLACGRNVVTTNVSGATELVLDGKNGFICMTRDPKSFADLVEKAVHTLPRHNEVSIDIAARYRKSDLCKVFLEALNTKTREIAYNSNIPVASG